MLDWASLGELAMAGFEIGAHTYSHPQLDTVPSRRARREIAHPKRELEQRLGMRIRSFAYPHGYSSRAVRRIVAESGYESACAVGNALSHPSENPLRLSRLLVRSTTSVEDVRSWLHGRGAPVASPREQLRTRLWRWYRRGRVWAGGGQEVEL
jgi:peptidoglycan/xylan/chitin deacetylase (PgdA/CDA1 family)